MLASAILRNKEIYLQYMHEIRADQAGHNDLVKKVYAGLQDVYMVAAVAARSVVDVGMTQPNRVDGSRCALEQRGRGSGGALL
jgi:hypothetical protein